MRKHFGGSYIVLSNGLRFLCLTRHRTRNFGEVLPSQSLGLVLMKLSLDNISKGHKNNMALVNTEKTFN